MKQLSTLILATLLFGTATAQKGQRGTQGSVLNLQMMQHGQFEVVIDELHFNQVGSVLEVPNLFPGVHRIFISELMTNRGNHGRGMTSKRIVYNGTINIPVNSIVWASVGHDRQLRIGNIEPLIVVPPNRDRLPLNDPYRKDGYGHGKGNGHGNGSGMGNRIDPDRRFDDGCSENVFSELRNIISRTSFDRDKLIIAGQFVRNNRINARQILQIIDLLSFESNKLEFAKTAYPSCIDKQNYFLVNKGFSFNSSIRELDLFIRHC